MACRDPLQVLRDGSCENTCGKGFYNRQGTCVGKCQAGVPKQPFLQLSTPPVFKSWHLVPSSFIPDHFPNVSGAETHASPGRPTFVLVSLAQSGVDHSTLHSPAGMIASPRHPSYARHGDQPARGVEVQQKHRSGHNSPHPPASSCFQEAVSTSLSG